MSIVENGSIVSVHYTGTLNDGTEFDSSRSRDPLKFQVGDSQVIAGFENAIIGMAVGESKTVSVPAENAYGLKDERAIQEISKDRFPEGFDALVGEQVTGDNGNGQPFMATIISEQETSVTLDFNHPLAGQDLVFEVEVVSIS
jgi:peptidylprolyl isomerase